MRFPFGLVVAHARKGWLRSTLTAGSVFVAVFVFGAMQTAVHSLDAVVQDSTSGRMIVESAVSLFVTLPSKIEQDLGAVQGVTSTTHWTWFAGVYISEKNFFARFATDAKSMRVVYGREVNLSDEAWEKWISTPTGCIVGIDIAEKYNFKVGDQIPMKGNIFPGDYRFEVCGIYKSRVRSFDQSTLFFHYKYMNEVSKQNQGPSDVVSIFALQLDDPANGKFVGDTIDAKFESSRNRTRTLTERAFQQSFATMWGNLPLFFNALSLVALAATFMVTLNTMLLSGRERIKECGILKTLGFGAGTMFGLLLSESLAYCLVGSALGGLAVGGLAGSVIPGLEMALHVPSNSMSVSLAIGATLGFLSGLAPARAAANMNIIEALRRRT